MGALELHSTVIPRCCSGEMVKSRRASKALFVTAPSQSPSPTRGMGARVTPHEFSAVQRPRNTNPNFQRVRDELGKLTRLGSVLNDSDEQSSNNGEDDYGQPATSLSSSSPDPVHISAQPEASAFSGVTALVDLKATLSTSTSAADAALAFQRWRISSLKELFTRELKNVLKEAQQDETRLLALEEEMEKKEKHLVHALADSAQLRAQLCALENVNGQHQGSSDVEVLQVDLVRALERATSSEAEVERYNKEIRKLRERLKSMEDEASRLDSELKANVPFLQKEKDGVAKENQVLLEQLARKDEEVLSQTQEINNLKSVLACLRVSRLELERLKTELQGNAAQQMKYANPESMGNTVLQAQMELDYHPSKASVPEIHGKAEEEPLPSSLFFSQLLDLLQKLTACLQKNEAYLDFPRAKISSEERQPNSPQRCLDAAAKCKPGQMPSLQQFVNDCHKKGFESSLTTDNNKKLNKLFTVTCWKWRWVAAASEVQELSKELNTLKSTSKHSPDKTVSFQQSSSTSCLENFWSCFSKEDLRSTEHPSVDLQPALTFDKVFSLLTSIWNVSSQSAHQEREAFLKNRQIEHLLEVMTRWMQRALKKRQLERVIAHWLRYLLQSWKDKFKHQNVNVLLGMAPTLDTSLAVSVPSHLKQSSCHNRSKHLVENTVHIKRSTNNTKARDVEIRTRSTKNESQKPVKDGTTLRERALETFQESLHHKLVALEALIIKEANSWHQEKLGEERCASGESLNLYSAPTNLVWKICCELEHGFFEARNQIMTFFGVWNKIPSCLHAESGNKVAGSSKPVAGLLNSRIGSSKVAGSSKPRAGLLNSRIGSTKNSVQANMRQVLGNASSEKPPP